MVELESDRDLDLDWGQDLVEWDLKVVILAVLALEGVSVWA